MGFFSNVINYIKNIDIKKYFKKVIPSKENFDNLANKFQRKKKPSQTSDAEYGFPIETSSTNRPTAPTTRENPPEPIYLQVMERKSVVGVVEPTSRSEEEPDTRIGRPSIYTNRTQLGINKLMNHLNEKRRTTIVMPEQHKKQAPNKPKRISHETDDLKTYILDSINEIEMIRHQIHMKSEIVKTVDCNEADLEFVKEYLTSCMMEIEDIDAKGTSEIQTAKEDALYYAHQWYIQLNNQLKVQRDAAEDVYIRVTLAQLDAVKVKINKLSSEAHAKDADSTDVIRRLSHYIDDIEGIDSKAILKLETTKRVTLQLAQELTEDIHAEIVRRKSEALIQPSNEDDFNTQIGEEDIYDEVSITSSSENMSIRLSDSDSDDDSVNGDAPIDNTDKNSQVVRRASQYIAPVIVIDRCEVQEQAVEIALEKNKLFALDANSKNVVGNCSKVEPNKSPLTKKQLKFFAVNLYDVNDAQSNPEENSDRTSLSTSSSSSFPSISDELQQVPRTFRIESPQPTLTISQQKTIPPRSRLSKDLEFSYTQESLQEILLCRNRLECLADSVQSFQGTTSDDEFVFLQENITFSMLTLNAIDAKSIKAVQDMKREAMMYGQIWYDDLEQRAREVVQEEVR